MRKEEKESQIFLHCLKCYKCGALFSMTGRQILIVVRSCCSSLRTSQVNTTGELYNKSPLKNTAHLL